LLRGGAGIILLAFPFILFLTFSKAPTTEHTDVDQNDVRPQPLAHQKEQISENNDLPHLPNQAPSPSKDMSLSEKAAEAVAGLVGPGTPKSVHNFRATTIGSLPLYLGGCDPKLTLK
jgi:hypothetical protein